MRYQSPVEERWNAWSHGLGTLLGIIGLFILLQRCNSESEIDVFSVSIYGLSIIILFLASTLYHSITNESRKHYFRIVDHISIYLLIAGTYTPVLLIMLPESKGWLLFWLVWGIALFGVVLKLFFTGRFEIFSTLLYLVMGWLIVFDYTFLSKLMDPTGLQLLFAGGAFYTLGIIFYVFEKIPFNHVIWHIFVLGGAICHYLMILFFVI
ncbi:hemolysin III family protein [Geojedonia litorea]|uniref:Hemolysin III family protein n=1 Tax=Geojedonia litorea TaxID=1268269 RepID=A0ABV9N2Z1_9FLAO